MTDDHTTIRLLKMAESTIRSIQEPVAQELANALQDHYQYIEELVKGVTPPPQ